MPLPQDVSGKESFDTTLGLPWPRYGFGGQRREDTHGESFMEHGSKPSGSIRQWVRKNGNPSYQGDSNVPDPECPGIAAR